jgi:hypothetical protein
MPTLLRATFQVTGWEQTPYDQDAPGPALARATVSKSYEGEVVGEGTAELLLCQTDPDDLSAGAGYVTSERIVGSVGDRMGSFVIQHGGLSGGADPPRTFGHVVPGSGTGELEGLEGRVEIAVDGEGRHTLTLEVRIAGDDS